MMTRRLRAVNVRGGLAAAFGLLALGLAPVAWANPGTYGMWSYEHPWLWVWVMLLIVAIKTPILMLITRWAWTAALVGVILANGLSTAAGGLVHTGKGPEIPAYLAVGVVVELAFLMLFGLWRRWTGQPLALTRLVPAVVLMCLATFWVAPALGPAPNPAERNRQQTCRHQLTELALAVDMYTMDYDETLPPVTTVDELRPRLAPYLRGMYADRAKDPDSPWAAIARQTSLEDAFSCPQTTGRWSLTRPAGVRAGYAWLVPWTRRPMRLGDIAQPALAIFLADDVPRHQGWRNCTFLDCHGSTMSEKEFQKYMVENQPRGYGLKPQLEENQPPQNREEPHHADAAHRP